MDLFDEAALVGGCLLCAQKLEFTLYGIVSHLSHLDEAKKEKRFRELTPEAFLRGSVSELKSTFGQIEKVFGNKLMLSSKELDSFLENRNTLVHNYWRLTHTNIRDGESLSNPKDFLNKFLQDAKNLEQIFNGLLWVLEDAFAKKEGRLDEIEKTQGKELQKQSYYEYVARNT